MEPDLDDLFMEWREAMRMARRNAPSAGDITDRQFNHWQSHADELGRMFRHLREMSSNGNQEQAR